MSQTANDLCKMLRDLNWTSDELKQIRDAFKVAVDNTARQSSTNLRIGSKVSFKTKSGDTVNGTIFKINRKTANVEAISMNKQPIRWKVSIGLLKAA